MKWLRAFGERFWFKARYEKRRNTLCTRKGYAASVRLLRCQRLRNISSFSYRRIGPKDPAKANDDLIRGSSKIKCLYTDDARRKKFRASGKII